MKKNYSVIFLLLLALLTGCSMKDFPADNDKYHGAYSFDWSKVSPDTVAPPSNPLVPPEDNTLTVKGVLIIKQDPTSVHVGLHATANDYQLLRGREVRLDEPMLQDFYLGDTICVTGNLKVGWASSAFFHYGIDMHEVHLAGAYKGRY